MVWMYEWPLHNDIEHTTVAAPQVHHDIRHVNTVKTQRSNVVDTRQKASKGTPSEKNTSVEEMKTKHARGSQESEIRISGKTQRW